MSDLALRRAILPTTLADARTLTGRGLRLSGRNVEGLITALALPIMLMLLFVYLFGGALATGTPYVDYVVPGVLLVCAGFGAAGTAVSVSHDLSGGIIDRFRSMDVRGEALISGQVGASLARNVVSTALVFAVALVIGFRSSAPLLDWLAALGVLLLFVVALSWLSAAIGILARSPEAASGLTFLIGFLPYPSSAFVPIGTMPSWLQQFAVNQPVTPVIDTIRGLLRNQPVGASAWHAVAWSLAIIVVSLLLSAALFRRRTR